MKFLVVLASVIAAVSAGGSGSYVAPYAPGLLPTFYNYGLGPYATGYSYGYSNAYPYATGYSYKTVGAASYPYATGYSYGAVGAAPYAVAPAVAPAAPLAYAPAFYSYQGAQTQYRSQDNAGNYAFGYAGGPSARSEVGHASGVVQGSFSYVDANNQVQTRSYVADAAGFRVAGTDIPVDTNTPVVAAAPLAYAAAPVAVAAPAAVVPAAPATVVVKSAEGPAYVPVEGVDVPEKTPEVKAAEAEHFAAHAAALARHKREARNYKAKPAKAAWAPRRAVKARNDYPIASVAVPAKAGKPWGSKKWKREADPEPLKLGKLLKKGHGRGYKQRRAYAPKKIVIVKKW